ncbi:MAG TPA: hypothetical protein VMA86_05930 [Acetobacteraceae bacterium]|nr:hypothetical protein [Acetobacteraceae bacterium]
MVKSSSPGVRAALIAICFIAGSARAGQAAAETTTFRCTNEQSGADWTLQVDSGNGTVDGYPATIGQRLISWHNAADQGFYTLDRANGDLKIVRGSSMGGWEMHALCRKQ